MNARITELIKNPGSFRQEDFGVLDSLIKQHPYVQSLRALYLYGTQQLDKDQYQENLSKTAAYTTDKKILYQFINQLSQPAKAQNEAATINYKENLNSETEKYREDNIDALEDNSDNSSTPVLSQENYLTLAAEDKPAPKPVYVDGELNRILFEGEENFLEEEHQGLDIESTLESGTLVVQKNVNPSKSDEEITPTTGAVDDFEESYDAENIPQISNIESDKKVNSETEIAPENSAEVSFHGTEDFLPEVKMPVANSISVSTPSKEVKLSRHEEEMQRLIAEVEAKMKASKKDKTEQKSEPEIVSKDINFSEVQEFAVKPKDSESPISDELNSEEKTEQKTTLNTEDENITELNTEWKPMSFENAKPDALIGKSVKEEVPESNTSIKTEQKVNLDQQDERPVMNLSFFTQQVASLEVKDEQDAIEEEKIKVEAQVENAESNVPTFINTWQKWLKIDKSKPEEQSTKTEDKNKIIEEFIVKEPKISKLREESDFVVRERGDNIAHLMTETLARLYVEQKLYSKAIQAYHILTEKHPDRKETYDKMIQDIKNLRLNK